MESSSSRDGTRIAGKKEYPVLLDELLHSAGIDQPKKITITPEIVRFVGCNAAMLLNQVLYWSVRSNKTRGFFKSDADRSRELGLKRSAIISARSRLEAMQIIKTEVKKARGAPTNHYKLNFEQLRTQFSLFMTLPARKWEQILKTYKPPVVEKKPVTAAQSAA